MKTKFRLEPPDGGWGVLICIGMAVAFISPSAAMASFGLIFGDFLKGLGAETKVISLITSGFYCSYSFSGLLSGSLFHRVSLRTVALIGGFSYFIGCVLQIFVNSTLTLALAFSLLQGIGFGLMVPAVLATFNNYFVKKRVLWMSFGQALIGVGVMFYPVVMKNLLLTYGFRGCLIVLAAINSHVVLGVLLMQPVKWHMRKVIINNEEEQMQAHTVELHSITEKKLSLDSVSRAEIKSLHVNNAHEDDSNHIPPPSMYNRKASHILSRDMLQKISSRCSSITSLAHWSGPLGLTDTTPEGVTGIASRRASTLICSQDAQNCNKNEKRSRFQAIVDFLDLTLLKQPIYINIVLGIAFSLYSDITFFTLQPLYLFDLGFSKSDTANIIAIGAAADLVSRITLALLAMCVRTPSRYIHLAGSIFTIFARFVFFNAYDFTSMAIITAVLGFFRTWIHVQQPLIFAEYLPKERFASGYGLFMFLKGNIVFAISPLIGYIRDQTTDYTSTFHCLNFIMGLCAVPWIIEIIYIKFRNRAKT